MILKKFVFLLWPLLLMTVACQRPDDGSTSSIQISVPQTQKMKMKGFDSKTLSKLPSEDVSALTEEAVLEGLIVNVKGSSGTSFDMYHSFFGCSDCNPVRPVNPSPVIRDIPMGSDRLFQVLVVYKSESFMTFYYGEATKTLTAPNESVVIPIESMAISVAGEGEIVGRYINADGTAPTGTILAKIKPSATAKAMTILKAPIVNGWFQVFSLNGVRFDYVLEHNAETLFADKDVSLSSFPTSSQVARVEVPAHSTYNNSVYWDREPESFVFGFFGPGAAGKTVCQQGFIGLPNSRYLTIGDHNPMNMDTTGSASNTILFSGGGSCGSTEMVDHMKVRALSFGEGKDNVASFHGAFVSSFQGPLQKLYGTSFSGPTMTFTLNLLPGVNNSLVSEIKIYRKQLASVNDWFNFHGDGIPCDAAARGELMGFTYLTSAQVGASSTGITATAPLTSSEAQSSFFMFCPVSAATGQVVNAGMAGKGLGTKSCPTCKYIRLEMSGTDSFGREGQKYVLGVNKCYPMNLKVYQSGSSANVSGNLTINNLNTLLGGGTYGDFYASGACTGSNNSPIISSGNNQASVYFKPTAVNASVYFDPPSMTGADSATTYFDNTQEFEVVTPSLGLDFPGDMLPDTCYRATAKLLLKGKHPISAPSTEALSLTSSSVLNMFDETNTSNCLSGTPPEGTVPFTVATSFKNFWVRRVSANTNAASVTVSTTAWGASPIQPLSALVNGPALVSKVKLQPMGAVSVSAGQCVPYLAILVNSADVETPAAANIEVPLVANESGTAWSLQGDCRGSLEGKIQLNFGPGESRRIVYLRTQGAGTITLVGGHHSLPVEFPSAGSVTVTPPAVGSAYLYGNFPQYRTLVISTHDLPQTAIVLSTDAGATVSCERLNPPSFSTPGVSCGADFDAATKAFTWSAASAVAGYGYRFSSYSPVGESEFTFIPEKLYGFGPFGKFQVKTCSVNLVAGTDDFDDVLNALTSNSVVCLGAGTFAAGSLTPAAQLYENKWVIGRLGAGGVAGSLVTGAAGAGTLFQTFGTWSSGQSGIANLEINDSAAAQNLFLSNIAGNVNIVSSNNKFIIDSASTGLSTAFYIAGTGAGSIRSYYDTFMITGPASSQYNSAIHISGNPGVFEVYKAVFNIDSQHSSYGSYGIMVDGASSNTGSVQINGSEMTGDGVFAKVSGGSTTTANLTIRSSKISNLSGGNTYPTFVVSSNGSLNLFESSVTNQVPLPVLKTEHSYAQPSNLTLNNSIFRQMQDYPLISRDAAQLSTYDNYSLDANQFIRMGAGFDSSAMIALNGGNASLNTSLNPAGGGNLICGVDSTIEWLPALNIGGGTVGGNLTLPTPVFGIVNNLCQ